MESSGEFVSGIMFLMFFTFTHCYSFVQGILVDIHVIIWSKNSGSGKKPRCNCQHDADVFSSCFLEIWLIPFVEGLLS